MTHADLKTLVDFNYWARDRMLQSVTALSAEQFLKPMGNSFSSVRDTLVHVYSAEWVWCSRWHGTSPMAPIKSEVYQDLESLKAAWHELEAKLRGFIDRLTEAEVAGDFEYTMMNGQSVRLPFWQQVQHLANHGSYHRGQIATLLRQLGAEPAGTDLITYYRERTIGA